MKKFYFLLLALGLFGGVEAQIINIPDATFKAKLLDANSTNGLAKDILGNSIKIDINNDSQIQASEALNVYSLDLNKSSAGDTLFNLIGLETFTNLKELDVAFLYNSGLDVSMLVNLEKLICSGTTQVATLNVSGLNNLKYLDCSNNLHLNSIVFSSLISLNYFNCSKCPLTTLNIAGIPNVTELICYQNSFPNLNLTTLTNLKKLNCSSSNVTNLNVTNLANLEYIQSDWNSGLTSLNLTGVNNLKTLISLATHISSLNLSNKPLLNHLELGNNDLTSLNVLQNTNLEYIDVGSNKLTSINVSGLSHLNTLKCQADYYGVKLTSVNLTGCVNLKILDLSYNDLSTLNLNDLASLEYLTLTSNILLTSLNTNALINLKGFHFENAGILALNLSNNILLTDVIGSNSKIELLDVSNNPNLSTLQVNYCPNLKSLLLKNGRPPYLNFFTNLDYSFNSPSLKYLCSDQSNMSFYQQILNSYNNTSCQINTYCNFHPGGVYYSIIGNQKLDFNNNGCDISDPTISNFKLKIVNGVNTASFVPDASGNYSLPVQAGTHALTPVMENPMYFDVFPSTVNVTFPTQTSPFTQNFCVTANGVHPDLEVTLLPLQSARPGFDAKYRVIYINKGNTLQSGTVNLLFNDAVLDLVSANPTVSNQTINNLSWNFTNLLPFETREIAITLNVNSPMETPAVNNGDVLNYTATISSAAIDDLPNDNTFAFNQTVVNSYDPNDKTCLEGTAIAPEKVGEYVHYMIRFENTGTFPAENIVVKDMIDTAKFDIASLVPMKGSHSYVTNITAGNKVEFIFENINLPFDNANNDGYVAFKIKTKPTLVLGNTFSNSASIYFDYNFPIVTNTATTTIAALGVKDFEFSNYFSLYPNPVHDVLNISAKENIEISSINIYNTLGQLVLVIPNAKDIKTVDVSGLTSGHYFIKVHSDRGTSNTKFIKN